jgi:hypothetical protein
MKFHFWRIEKAGVYSAWRYNSDQASAMRAGAGMFAGSYIDP